jgi:23S rRNA (guanosine2251-2'-O)-methyltransferase
VSVIYGVNPVLEALRGGRRPVERIAIAQGTRIGRFQELVSAARAVGVPVFKQPSEALDRAAGGRTHQGVVAWVGSASYASLDAVVERMAERPLVVLLDGVEDPHNLGAIIRTAECAGVAGVVIPERGAVGLTDVVAKTSAGALEHVPVARVTNLVSTMEALKKAGAWVVGFDGAAPVAYTTHSYSGPTALVFGGEGKGLRRLVAERCDLLLSIPLFGNVTSLNVSVSVGVVLFEARRQLGNPAPGTR